MIVPFAPEAGGPAEVGPRRKLWRTKVEEGVVEEKLG